MRDLPKDTSEVVARSVVGDAVIELVRTTRYIEAFTFTAYDGRAITFDISEAKRRVLAGHVIGLAQIDRESLAAIVAANEWDESKVPDADPTVPGIAVQMNANGQTINVMVDGMHRAAKALRTGSEFTAWVLTVEATRACYVQGSRELLP